MKFDIKSTGIALTPAIRSFVDEKLSHLDRFIDRNDQAIRAHIEIGKSTKHHQKGDFFRAEINLEVSGTVLRVVNESADLYAAIDLAQNAMREEITSWRGKEKTLFRRGARAIKNLLKGLRGVK
jgi:ribosomal subunit interface protein